MELPLWSVAHSRTLRRFLVRSRYVLALLLAAGLVWFARPHWFWWAVGVSFCGELIQLWSASSLQKNEVFQPRGPYTLIRNPMYLGRFFVILGMVAVPASVYPLIGYVLLFLPYVVARVSREERKLAQLFGEPYIAYLARVPRFIPMPGRAYRAHGSPFSFRWELVVRNGEHLNALGLVAFYILVRLRLAL